jgi:hypothetical protein
VAVLEGVGGALGVGVAQHVALGPADYQRRAADARQPLGQRRQAGADLGEGLLGEMAAGGDRGAHEHDVAYASGGVLL